MNDTYFIHGQLLHVIGAKICDSDINFKWTVLTHEEFLDTNSSIAAKLSMPSRSWSSSVASILAELKKSKLEKETIGQDKIAPIMLETKNTHTPLYDFYFNFNRAEKDDIARQLELKYLDDDALADDKYTLSIIDRAIRVDVLDKLLALIDEKLEP